MRHGKKITLARVCDVREISRTVLLANISVTYHCQLGQHGFVVIGVVVHVYVVVHSDSHQGIYKYISMVGFYLKTC